MKLFIILFLFCTSSLAQEKDLSQKEADEQTVEEILKNDSQKIDSETTPTAPAVENTPAPSLPVTEDQFAGIVQHTEGRPYIVGTKKNYLDFKDLIKFGDTIIVPKKTSKLKIITQKRCIAVLYENTKAIAPKDKQGSWKVSQGAVRWICPEEKIETVEYKTGKVEIANGEILISKNQVVVLKSKVTDGAQELKLESIYTLKKGTWVFSSRQKDPHELYKYEKSFPTPIESSRKDITPPEDPRVFRLTLGVAPLGWGFVYHHENEGKLSDYNLEAHGIKIGANFLVGKTSLITFLEWGEGENQNSRNSNSSGPQEVGYKSIRNEYLFLGIGLRHTHEDSSSFYYFAGLGTQKYKYNIRPDSLNDHYGEINYDYNIGVGAGFQKIFFHKNWISLVLGVEVKVLQSLTQGDASEHNNSQMFFGGSDLNPESTYTSGFAHIYLGPVFNF